MRYDVLACVMTVVLVSLAMPIYAHDVQMNLKYSIGTDDRIYADGSEIIGNSQLMEMSKKYIVSQSSGIVAGLVFAGSVFNSLGMTTGGNDYTISIQQGDENKFIILMTNGTYETVDEKYESVGELLSTSFGYAIGKSINFMLYLQLRNHDVDIIDSVFWQGERVLQVRNEGKNERGITKISITKIK
ncbi:MAG: hypothetical protein V1870_01120 [Candidatus Aenigmatarchaeota archaeon]